MTLTFWSPNAQTAAQVVTGEVTAVANAAALTATINGKTITYTCTLTDTVDTAAAAWQALLSGDSAPLEFAEITWTVDGAIVTATANAPGTPFAGMTGGLVFSAGGGAAVTQTEVTANSSPSDVSDDNNWIRGAVPGIPQDTDDVEVSNSSVPLLWNLDALAAVKFGSYQRLQSFEGTIGLPARNPAGYREYRPTSFQFAGPAGGTLVMTLGAGTTGGGPGRERYDAGSQRTALTVLASGGAADTYAVTFLGTHASNVVNVVGTSVGVAMLPGEVSTLASAIADGGGTLALGSGVTFSGELKAYSASLVLFCAPATLTMKNGCVANVQSTGLTYAAITADEATSIVWTSNSTITALTLSRASSFNRSADVRAMTITDSTIDADCQIVDPNATIVYTNATLVRGQVTSGPFVVTGDRHFKVTS